MKIFSAPLNADPRHIGDVVVLWSAVRLIIQWGNKGPRQALLQLSNVLGHSISLLEMPDDFVSGSLPSVQKNTRLQ